MTNTILSGLCSSGKTTAAINTIVSSDEKKFLFVIPSIKAGQEVAEKLARLDSRINIHLINEEAVGRGNVRNEATKILSQESAKFFKHVVIITTNLYTKLTADLVADWNVFHDELPAMFDVLSVSFDSRGQNTFDKLFSIDAKRNVGLLPATINTEYHGGKSAGIVDMIDRLSTGRYIIHALRLPSEANTHKQARLGKFLVVPSSTYYIGKTVTLMAADADMEPSAKYLNASITNLTPSVPNHDSKKIKIKYVFDKNDNTRTFRDGNQEAIKQANDIIEHDVSGHKTLLWMNDNNPHPITHDNFHRTNHNIFGANDYSDYASVAFLSSMNVDDQTASVLEKTFGIDSETIYWRNTLYTGYQCVMRGNLRRMEETLGYTIYVYDLKLAASLKHMYFPNAELIKIGNVEVAKKAPKTVLKEKIEPQDRNKLGYIIIMNKEGYYVGADGKLVNSIIDLPRAEAVKKLKASHLWDALTARGRYSRA